MSDTTLYFPRFHCDKASAVLEASLDFLAVSMPRAVNHLRISMQQPWK